MEFHNASDALHRNKIFHMAYDEMPALYQFVRMCYGSASLLSSDSASIGWHPIKKCDPPGTLLCYKSSVKLASSMSSEFHL
jgi:hypothetical protein